MMNTTQWSLWAGILLSSTQLAQAAPDYFRFEPGSVREYRAQTHGFTMTEDHFTIQVGNVGFMHNGHVHYPVTGYAAQPLLAYQDEATGALYHLDQDTDQDVLVTSVEKGPGWFQANYRPCDQEGRVVEQPAPYSGPAGYFANTLAIQYRSYGCADHGIDGEVYVENIGMVERTVQTLAGPVRYDLVHASIGPMSFTEAPSTSFSVSVRKAFGPTVIAALRWDAVGTDTDLQFPSSQEFEVVLRNSRGDAIWRWSDGKFFTPQVRNRSARHLSYDVDVPLQFWGILLPEGTYTVEAWLATATERQYAGAASFVYTHPAVPGEGRKQ